jgi:TPR repeat protein
MKSWEGRMQLRPILPFLFTVFFAVSLSAQQPIPISAEQHLATVARVNGIKASDLNAVVMKAHEGEREAQHLLALVYERGHLLSRDLATAQIWMAKSADHGYVPAELDMGLFYLHEPKDAMPVGDYGRAERWLRLAATQGDADAQFWLGLEYERGAFGLTDYHEAYQWLHKAAEQGLPNAQYSLGQMYELGEGVPKTDIVAGRWFKAAADHLSSVPGVWEAEVELAYMYRDGRLRDSEIEAYKWLAIVDGSVVPPISDDTDLLARHMSKRDTAEAQRMADDWLETHSRKPNF